MTIPIGLAKNDAAIQSLIVNIKKIISSNRLEPDRRTGDWFSSNQLEDLRQILETRGYAATLVYLQGKLDRGTQAWEQKRLRVLSEILPLVKETRLEITVASYIIGKLNQILKQEGK